MSQNTEPNFLNPNEAAIYLRVSKSHLARLRVQGGGPRYAKLGPKLVVYRLEDLQTYVDLRLRDSTSDVGREAR
ncbi:DNA-binding protein [Anderseniella sp. Alg231-50]|uniref:DNA-binding protein n=1 Tax=Anderseniella sp. Alg231-50 TaxID=1922226 RepID=UPI000D54C2A5